MASSIYDDDATSDSSGSEFTLSSCYDHSEQQEDSHSFYGADKGRRNNNVIHKLMSREIYGRVTRNPRAKTENILSDIHTKCRFQLKELLGSRDLLNHVFMGFTLCGRFMISYKMNFLEGAFPFQIEYVLYIWRFIPGQKLVFVASHNIFKFLPIGADLLSIKFAQFPTDPFKLICYGLGKVSSVMAFLTILTLPYPNNCKYCKPNSQFEQGWCTKHGFMIQYMFSLTQPIPPFNPRISLAYPDHLVINTGVYIHILNIKSQEPVQHNIPTFIKEFDQKVISNFADNASESSEVASDNFSMNSTVEAILEDFSEYDLEGIDCNKPFHELNISCEPLNVTGKSYHNTVVQNIVDPRVKRLQNGNFPMPQSSGLQKTEKSKVIDKKIAEKAYEFTEENEKCEKLSSFRKKRLADKKYEFSEDNSENIIPFNMLRRERRFFYRSQRSIRSPELGNALFLSPRSPGIRSPMQSPNSRNGQFSPGGTRTMYCPSSIRNANSPHHSKSSPISPRDHSSSAAGCGGARKFNVYSPIADGDDYDTRFVKQDVKHNFGLLIVDNKKEDYQKWIKKVVRRYSSADFDISSLVSGQTRDDFDIPIEIPLIVQTLTDEQQLETLPECKADKINETQLIISQKTFDCEHFIQTTAQKLCSKFQLDFLHCEDYDIKLLYICPLSGVIVCQAVIKISALLPNVYKKPKLFVTNHLFTWSIATEAFELIESPNSWKLDLYDDASQLIQIDIPQQNMREVLVMDFNPLTSKNSLRDYQNRYEICSGPDVDHEDEFDW